MRVIDEREFECKKCGACCKWEGVVLLTPEDATGISNYLSIDKKDFLKRHTEKYKTDRVLKNKLNSSSCTFLEDNKCSVWDAKPEQCNDFPKKFDKRCPGFHIDNRSASMSDRYEMAVKAVNQKLSSSNGIDKSSIDGIFKNLHQTIKSASIVSVASENGIDPFFDESRIKVASLDDLFSFDRIGSNQLIHKCTHDLWSIDSDKDGNVQIKRLFDNTGDPIKG
jgi:Fe-S-cluster containining protein